MRRIEDELQLECLVLDRRVFTLNMNNRQKLKQITRMSKKCDERNEDLLMLFGETASINQPTRLQYEK